MSVVKSKTYVEYRNEGYWIIETRISLDSVIYRFLEGLSPESIRQCFPLLTLEQVYGAIAFYLANRTKIDNYLATEEEAWEMMAQPLQTSDPTLYQKLITCKHKTQQ
jgi:uncharacterized protein (DUF433 family)